MLLLDNGAVDQGPYARGWLRARRGAETLARQLAALGLEPDFPGLSADVNVFGDGLVSLGSIRPEAAVLLAELIVSGLASEIADGTARTPGEHEP